MNRRKKRNIEALSKLVNFESGCSMKRIVLIGSIIIALTAGSAAAETAESIVNKMEENLVHKSSKSEGEMIVTDRFGTKRTTFVSWARGKEDMLIEFTSKEERGQKILRTNDEIYLYYPDAEELIRIQGPALRDSVMGSDMSYEDMTGNKGILDSYRVTLDGSEKVDGRDCYTIDLAAKSRDVPYHKQTMWVDKEEYIYRKIHQFSRSGDLLKELIIEETLKEAGKTIPSRMIIRDVLKKDSKTVFILKDMKINIYIDPSTFSLEELTW